MTHRPRFRHLAAVLATLVLGACADAPSAPSAVSPLLGNGGPNFLECPVNTAQASIDVVGPLGGLLSLGRNAVSIPSGAVPVPTAFALTVPASRFMKVDVTAVGLEHYLFGAPVTVTIDYSRCPEGRTAGRALSVWYVAPILNTPLQNMGGTNDPVARTITFTTDHFSGYAIAN